MAAPLLGLSLMLENEFLSAALPLFENGEVEALEWSFDTAWGDSPLPAWADELLAHYSGTNRLFGHGVSYSMFSADNATYHARWLKKLEVECSKRSYRHISEHFGFMKAGDFHRGAPLPLPLDETSFALGVRGIESMKRAAQKPIGLENLAFAFCSEDVRGQGVFLAELLSETSSFLLLDLHNIYCQLCNFNCTAEDLLVRYPLELVREVHVSGGSWSEARAGCCKDGTRRVRRDTHDEAVPEEVFSLLSYALAHCPNIDVVVYERLGTTLSEAGAPSFREDFRQLREILSRHAH